MYTSSKSAYPQVVLKEIGGNSFLPIVIGRFEAAAIALARNERKPVRPISYDLAYTILEMVNAHVEKVEITDLHEGTYYAQVYMCAADGQLTVLDSRPSDAIALALRMGAPIFAAPAVLKEAGYVRPEESARTPPATAQAAPPEQERTATRTVTRPATAPGIKGRSTEEQQPAATSSLDRLELLRRRLRQAVAEEVYEEAARLRDEISRLEEGADN